MERLAALLSSSSRASPAGMSTIQPCRRGSTVRTTFSYAFWTWPRHDLVRWDSVGLLR